MATHELSLVASGDFIDRLKMLGITPQVEGFSVPCELCGGHGCSFCDEGQFDTGTIRWEGPEYEGGGV